MGMARYLDRLAPAGSEAAYETLVAYGFARRYVGGKVVADVGWDEVGPGPRLLTESAASVVGFTRSAEALDQAAAAYPAPNVKYEKAEPSDLPYPEDHFDVVVALSVVENMEHPDVLLVEARRVLKADGVFIVSALEGRGTFVPELVELLEKRFQGVRLYRVGAVAGGFVFPDSGDISGASVESARASVTEPGPSVELPPTRSVLAVCGDAGILEHEEQPYLLLDRDRRVFDECDDRTEDVELLRGEIRRMQQTEVQAFQDSLKLHVTEVAHLRAQVRQGRVREAALRNQLRAMENSTTWRLFEPYRLLRARIDAARGSSGDAKGSGDDGSP
jgi:SAM-dependent methyltransferase